jgi:HSP20 family protein
MTEKNNKSRKHENNDSTALALPNGALSTVFDNLFEPFFRTPFAWPEFGIQEPALDLQDRGKDYSLTVQLPGYSKDDVEVRVNSNSVELKAERNSETKSKSGDKLQNSYSLFHRYISLPDQIVADKADGTMKNGILELKLPKRQQKRGEDSRRVDLN